MKDNTFQVEIPNYREDVYEPEDLGVYVPENKTDRENLRQENIQSLAKATDMFFDDLKSPTSMTIEHIRASTREDPLSKSLFKYVSRKREPKRGSRAWHKRQAQLKTFPRHLQTLIAQKRLSVSDNILKLDLNRYYVGPSCRERLLYLFHDCSWFVHPGPRNEYLTLKTRYYWPGMDKDCKQF